MKLYPNGEGDTIGSGVINGESRFPGQCFVTYNTRPFLNQQLASCSGFGSLCDDATKTWHTVLLVA